MSLKRLFPRRFLFLLLFTALPSTAAFGFLHNDNGLIVDSTGTPVLLRGYGLGGWLVPEGYMLNTPGFGSPRHIHELIEDLIGPQATEDFWRAYRANYVAEADIQLLADWGFNSIRLPFHYVTLYDTVTQTFDEEGFALVDTLLAWCKARDMYLILDMHCAPGGQNDGNISDSDGILARLWTDPANQDLTVYIWEEIARRYVDEPMIGGYDLINEPVLPNGVSTQFMRQFYIRLTDAIRAIDTNHILFIEGNWYATDFTSLTPPWDPNMSYSFHKYWGETDQGSIGGYLAMRAQHGVPLWLGETGENSNSWYYENVQLMENNDIGWCWWAHKKLGSISSPLTAAISDDYDRVLEYWRGNASRPTQSFAINALMDMADGLRLARCEVNAGVIPSLMDPDFGTTATPYANLTIPGDIPATHYDVGYHGLGHVDQDYKNTGQGYYNQGWVFRNDGVDIEASDDGQGNGYNVGWIAPGERLNYTVNVRSSGEYLLLATVSAPDPGGSFVVLLDGNILAGPIQVPATGGWQSWQQVQVPDLPMDAGSHQLTMLFTGDGFNFSRMTFFQTATGIDDDGGTSIAEFELHPTYPNPFNGMTTVAYSLAEAGAVTVTVFDLLGRRVDQRRWDRKPAGSHQFRWDAGSLASGEYILEVRSGERVARRRMTLVR